MSGIKCPPSTHRYRALGKIVYCERCADVQPLLLEEPDADRLPLREPRPVELSPAFPESHGLTEPTAAELEAHIARLREAAGLAEREAQQEELFGQRQPYDGDLSQLEMIPDRPRSRVDEGYATDPREDRLPSAGL